MKENTHESRLSRWSRRKQQSREETQLEDSALNLDRQGNVAPLTEPVSAGEVEQAPNQQPDQPILTDADMPPIETLNSESDFSLFMSSGVTDKLRNLALKQLFKAPLFNLRDGLDEYDEDYTFFEKLGDTVTCDMKHQLEMQALKKEAEAAAALEANATDAVKAEESATDKENIDATDKENIDKDKEPLDDAETIDQVRCEADSEPDGTIDTLDQPPIPIKSSRSNPDIPRGELK